LAAVLSGVGGAEGSGQGGLGFCAAPMVGGLGAEGLRASGLGGVLRPLSFGAESMRSGRRSSRVEACGQISRLRALVATKEEEDERSENLNLLSSSTSSTVSSSALKAAKHGHQHPAAAAKVRGWPGLVKKPKRHAGKLPILPAVDLRERELLDRSKVQGLQVRETEDPAVKEAEQGERGHKAQQLGSLGSALNSPTTLDALLNGVPVGHGIRCQSPLKLMTEGTLSAQPRLASVVGRIHHAAVDVSQSTNACQHIEFTEEQISKVRDEVAAVYSSGEKSMTQLTHLLGLRLSEGQYECSSRVSARAADGLEFSLVEPVPAENLINGENSLSLAEKQLSAMKVQSKDEEWANAEMTDHSIEFEALQYNAFKVHRMIAHARPNSDAWKVISNSIFGIDHPDVPEPRIDEVNMFNMKIIAEDKESAAELFRALRTINFMDHELQNHNLPVTTETRRLELLAQDAEQRISTVMWNGAKMGIEILTLDEHYAQTERLAMEARRERHDKQEHATMALAEKSSVFGFSRDLLHWVLDPETFNSVPSCDRIRVSVH